MRGSVALGALMPEEARDREWNRIQPSESGGGNGQGPGPASRGRVHGKWEMGGESRRSPREGRGKGACPEASTGKGQARADDSLLSDDVVPWQGRAGHPRDPHVLCNLGEVQTQVHAMDGHSSPSFRWSRYRQNLSEGNGISDPVWAQEWRLQHLNPLPGRLRDLDGYLGEWRVFSPCLSFSSIPEPSCFTLLPWFFR